MSNPSNSNWTTNVNRVKTKRWVEAKSYSYDGDDWGDADEYGEYDEPQAAPAPKPTGLRKATAPASSAATSSPTNVERERANSFGRDDERRAFSGPTRTAYAQPQPSQNLPAGYTQEQPQHPQWAQNAPAAMNTGRGPMLNSSSTPYDSRTGSMVSNTSLPAAGRRKASMGQTDQALAITPISTNVPPPAIGTPDKPSTPTIIRPADIYRRIQEEREKERLSQESSRPSLSGLARDESPAGKSDRSGIQAQPLPTNAMAHNTATPAASSLSNTPITNTAPPLIAAPTPLNPGADSQRSKGPSHSPKLPEISGLSGFGDDFGGSFMSSSEPIQKTVSESTVTPIGNLSPPAGQLGSSQQPGLQHQSSFGYKSVVNQAFDQAVPPTPSSTSGSGVDRSNSDSTNNISPIISREVSSAVRPEGMSNISAIAEEPAGSSRPGTSGSGTKRKSGGVVQTDASSQAAFIPGHRRDTSLPSANNSPARTPALETNKDFIKPQEAEVAITTPIGDDHPQAGRERSASPAKSRVRNLVDKIDSANNSRRGSDNSNMEKQDPTLAQRPVIESKESFRPSLPGAWTSYTTNPPPIQTLEAVKSPSELRQARFTESPVKESSDDAFAKASVAGSALAGAFAAAAVATAGVVTGHQSEETGPPERASKTDTVFHPEAARLSLPRNDSNTPSSIVPTPLEMKADGESKSEYFNTVPPLQPSAKPASATTLAVPQGQQIRSADDMSTKSSPTDFESDRLRKEIVRELSPQREDGKKDAETQPKTASAEGQVGYSSIYDSYLDDDDTPGQMTAEVTQKDKVVLGKTEQDSTASSPPNSSGQPMFSSTSGPLEDVPEIAPDTDMTHTLTRAFSWETPIEILPLEDFRSSTATNNTRNVAEPQVSTVVPAPTVQARDVKVPNTNSPPELVDSGAQLPVSETLTNQKPSSEQSEALSRMQTGNQKSSETILPPQSTAKVPAFREIMAIQSTPQRIQVYDQTRATFANMDTGLSQWIQATINSLPEHDDLVRNGGVFPVVVRAAVVPGVQGPQVASSGPRPSFGPSANKTVKGKDILHSAGVFGGKTSSAAKGLFAKGKSKWRGGADKASKRFRGLSLNSTADPPPKPYEQLENTWETDASVPQFSRQLPDDSPANKAALSTANLAKSQAKRPDGVDILDSVPSNSVSPPTTVHLDSPTLGRSNTISGAPISPLSGKTSFERKRASLAQKRASMEVPGSVRSYGRRKTSSFDSHRHAVRSRDSIEKRLISPELQARLTIHQNQMRSFAEDFPTNLIIPAEYRVSDPSADEPKLEKDATHDLTPTQADFPKNVLENVPASKSPIAEQEELKKNERKAAGAALWLDTTGIQQDHAFDGPASPDYAVRPQNVDKDDEQKDEPETQRPLLEKHFSSLSFIQFDPVPSEDLALKVPITPKRFSAVHERPNIDTESQPDTQDSESSFADYPAAEDFGALPSGESLADSTIDHRRSLSVKTIPDDNATDRPKISQHLSESSNSTRSRNSMLGQGDKGPSTEFSENPVENSTPVVPENSVFPMARNTGSINSFKRHSMLSDIRESREIQSYSKDARSQNRKSLLGLGLSMKGSDPSTSKQSKTPKFSLIPSARRRADTNLSNYEADPARPSLTIDGSAARVQRAATTPLNADRTNLNTGIGMQTEKTKKKRFSGLSSFINKTKPRISAANSSLRGRSNTPTKMNSKADSTMDLRERDDPSKSRDNLSIATSQTQSHHQRTISRETDGVSLVESVVPTARDQLPVPASHIRNYTSIPDINSNQNAVINKLTAPPEEGADYKSVYPPEFFGEQPPEGYYGPEEDPSTETGGATAATAAAATSGSDATVLHPGASTIPSADAKKLEATSDKSPTTEAKISSARHMRKPSGPRPMIDRQGDNGDSTPTTFIPPPPPPKDSPKHSVTTTTTTTSTFKGPTKTTTETETAISPPVQHDSQFRGRGPGPAVRESVISTNVIPASPVVQMATTRTVTRIANGRSVSPRPRNQNRSSIPMVAPLNIAKRSVGNDGQNKAKEIESTNYETLEKPHNNKSDVVRALTVDTRTESGGPPPVEQFSYKPDPGNESKLVESVSPPPRSVAHPFIAKRKASSPQPNLNPDLGNKTVTSDLPVSPKVNADVTTVVQERADAVATRRTADRDRQESGVLGIDDPVLIVPPLTIRKSPDLGNRHSPELSPKKPSVKGLRKSPNLSLRDGGFPAVTGKGPVAPLPLLPNRMSLHSPPLKDSPTLPRSTPPSSKTMTPVTGPSPRISTVTSAARSSTPPPQIVQTQDPEPHEPTPVSPVPLEPPAAPIGRAMTPVEKMKDEPGINEPVKDSDESEDEIVMSSTAYPGQEWRPDYGYGGWDGYE